MQNTSLTQAQESAQLSAASTEALEVQTASAGTDSQPRTAAGEVVPAEPKHGDSVDQSAADPSPVASEAPELNSYTYFYAALAPDTIMLGLAPGALEKTLEERVATLEKALDDLRVVLLHHGIRGPQ